MAECRGTSGGWREPASRFRAFVAKQVKDTCGCVWDWQAGTKLPACVRGGL